MNVLHHKSDTNRKTLYAILLLSFFLLAYILPLGARHLVVPDETRYGEIPREMIAGGDWVVPHLDGLRYFEKPVLGYWVHAASLLLFGENNFAVRFPSALAAGLSALLIYVLVRNASSGKEDEKDGFTAFTASLIFLSCFEVFGVGNTAVLDSLFAFFLTATITAFYFSTEAAPGSGREKGFLLLSGLGCGLAFLTKGFLAFAVPVLVLAPYLVWQRRFSDLFRMGRVPILTAVIVSLPWCILIHIREPDFWRFFFWNEHIRRFLADNAQHKESFRSFLLTAPAMFIPWIFLLPAAVPGVRARLQQPQQSGRLVRLCICWAVLPFLFFSFSKGKLLTYILPCFPPFSILMAFGLMYILKKKPHSLLFKGGVLVNGLLFGLILIAFLFVQLFGFGGIRPYSQPWKGVMVINGLVFFVLFCYWAVRSRNIQYKLVLFGMAPLLFFFVIHYTIPDATNEVKSPGPMLERHQEGISKESVIISDENSVRAVCWYLKRNDVYVLCRKGELDYGFEYEDGKKRFLKPETALDLIQKNRGRTILVARARNVTRWRKKLPPPVFEDQNGPSGYVFWTF